MASFITDDIYNLKMLEALDDCALCPRNCHVNRNAREKGYCNSDSSFQIASITLHHGEEPVISGKQGICNIFFSHCNLQCVYCQNHQISDNQVLISKGYLDEEQICNTVFSLLSEGVKRVGFVSPGHLLPQMKIIIHAIRLNGYDPFFVYNTNAYDKKEAISKLNGLIHIFLPDYKYADNHLALKYSGVCDYAETALSSIQEMYRLTGNTLIVDDEGNAMQGLIIRHLVLPGHTDNSMKVLENIAEYISPNIHISLMSQYHPAYKSKYISPLNRKVYQGEYRKVEKFMADLGMYYGWIQDPCSSSDYLPDFKKSNPFH